MLRNHIVGILDKLSQFIEMFGDPMDNPMAWPTKGLLEMGKCKNGMNFHADDSGVEVHCLGVGDFKDLSVIRNTDELPVISLNQMPAEDEMLHDGDIVFVRSNGNKMLVGRCLVVYPGEIPTTYSGFCIRYRKDFPEADTMYLLQLLKMDSTRVKMAGRGANIQNLNQQILSSLQIPLPPLEMQREFVDFVEQSDKSKFVFQIAIYRDVRRSL
jgi:type I restriction enzyme S subunit